MIAPMAKKAAKGDGGKDRKGDVTKQDVSEFIGELQIAIPQFCRHVGRMCRWRGLIATYVRERV